jgi:hypothetical protein
LLLPVASLRERRLLGSEVDDMWPPHAREDRAAVTDRAKRALHLLWDSPPLAGCRRVALVSHGALLKTLLSPDVMLIDEAASWWDPGTAGDDRTRGGDVSSAEGAAATLVVDESEFACAPPWKRALRNAEAVTLVLERCEAPATSPAGS